MTLKKLSLASPEVAPSLSPPAISFRRRVVGPEDY